MLSALMGCKKKKIVFVRKEANFMEEAVLEMGLKIYSRTLKDKDGEENISNDEGNSRSKNYMSPKSKYNVVTVSYPDWIKYKQTSNRKAEGHTDVMTARQLSLNREVKLENENVF